MLDFSPAVGSYDGVTATLSMFELSRGEIEGLVRKWWRWMKPGGCVMICTFGAGDCEGAEDNMYDVDGECASGVPWRFMGRKVFLTVFTKGGWTRMMQAAGFEIVYTETNEFKVPAEDCDDEMHYFVIARRPVSS